MNLSYSSVLNEWEIRLSSLVRIAQLRLLGELDISQEDCQLLGRAIGERCRLRGNSYALAGFERETPCVFATFLVAQGVWGYSEQQYWPSVEKIIGVDLGANLQSEWGRTFRQILEDLNKPLFDNIKEGHRHIKVILAHGGIPQYCLPDFFKHLLLPAVTRQRYVDLETSYLIEELLDRSTTSFADRPVRRFLQYGGRVAENFFERCCVMAREFIETAHVPNVDEVGLPKRIVEGYRQWTHSQPKITRSVETEHELRFRKPEFVFNPWNGFTLKLPPQSIPREFSESTFFWRIHLDDEIQTVDLRLRRGFDQRTTERDFQINHPAQTYEVSFVIDGQARRTWRFEGISLEKPVVFFEASSGLWQRPTTVISPQRFWLVFPKDGLVEWEGIVQPVNLPECFGGWADYTAQEVDLAQVSRFTLRHSGRSHSWSVGADEAKFKPHFVGGVPFAIPQLSRRAMLYVGEPPAIRIPLSGKHSPKDELENWRITIRSRETTLPLLRTPYYRLTELNPLLDEAHHFAEVQLNSPNLLGRSPYGTYDIQVRGPLGLDAELPLRIWQDLSIEPLPPVCWPDPIKGPLEIPIRLTTNPQDKITCPKEDGRVESAPSNTPQTVCRHTVYAYPNTSGFHLTLSRLTPSGDISIPLEIPVPRPRWLLRDEASQTMLPEWSAYVLHESLDILNQMTAPALWLSMPVLVDNSFQVQLRLTSSGNAPVSSWEKRQPEQHQWRFSLLQFRDDLRASRESVLHFELACAGLLDSNAELITPILSVTQKLLVENIGLKLLRSKGQSVLKLTWHEPKQRLRHRHVRLWFVWEPWKPPIEEDIPDDAIGLHEISFTREERRFRVQFIIKDPFVSPLGANQMPTLNEERDIDLVSPTQRLQRLNEKINQDHSNEFQFRLEQAYIQESLGDVSASLRLAHWGAKHVGNGRLPEILALHDLAKHLNDPALPELEEAIFTPEKIEWWQKPYSRKEKVADQFETYLRRIPPAHFEALPISIYRWMLEIEEVQQAALDHLMRLADVEAIFKTLELFRQKHLTEGEALELLVLAGQSAAQQLSQRPDDELAMRVLLRLAPRFGVEAFVVTTGMWVRTDAGWCCIDEIFDPTSDQPCSQFMRHERRHRLHATLRPTRDAEPIVIDFPGDEVVFTRGDPVYYCSKCQQFAACDRKLVEEHYHAWHGERLLNPAQRWGGGNALMLNEKYLRFLHSAPKNEME